MLERASGIAASLLLTMFLVGCGGTTFTGEPSPQPDAGASGGTTGVAGGPSSGGNASGGARATGGAKGSGGSPADGGRPGAGGRMGKGGSASGSGGASAGGAPAAGGKPGSGGGSGSGGAPGAGGASGSGGAASCNVTTCNPPFTCCGNACVNTANDPLHCGSCDTGCANDKPFCANSQCGPRPCTPQSGTDTCAAGTVCCGTTCCTPGQICCSVTANFTFIGCYDPAQSGGTCPRGCPLCVCAAPDTPVATPAGERAIASLRLGDRVLSVDRGRVVDVPVLAVRKSPASNHHVVRVELSNGSVLEISAPHPTADGRVFGDLRENDTLGGVRIERVSVVPYAAAFTYDILPASDSGTYFAGGVLIGSTLGGTALSSGAGDFATLSYADSALSTASTSSAASGTTSGAKRSTTRP